MVILGVENVTLKFHEKLTSLTIWCIYCPSPDTIAENNVTLIDNISDIAANNEKILKQERILQDT